MALGAASRKADGGSMKAPEEPAERVDMTPGGPVQGEGTETSDSIPAWLSDEEYVVNARGVQLPRDETAELVAAWNEEGGSTQDLIESINEAGLKERYGDQARMVEGEAKPNGLLDGGMLGIALGAGATTYNVLRQQDEQNRIRDEQLRLAQKADERETARHEQVMKKSTLELEDATHTSTARSRVAALQGEMEGHDNLRVAVEQAGGVDSYITANQGDIEFSPEQKQAIRQAAGISLSPTTRYQMQLRQADALRATNPELAIGMEKAAHSNAAGKVISAVQRGDADTVKALYNIFPNGDTVEGVSFGEDDITFTRKDGKTQTMPKREFLRGVQAMYDPSQAINGEVTDERNRLLERRLDLGVYGRSGTSTRTGTGSGAAKADKVPDSPITFKDVHDALGIFDGGKSGKSTLQYKEDRRGRTLYVHSRGEESQVRLDTFLKSLECLAIRGHLVSYGAASGPPDPIAPSILSTKSMSLTRPTLFQYTATRPELLANARDVFKVVLSGAVKIQKPAEYKLKDAAQAHIDLTSRKTTGSIILIP
jgi:hypothetical protein